MKKLPCNGCGEPVKVEDDIYQTLCEECRAYFIKKSYKRVYKIKEKITKCKYCGKELQDRKRYTVNAACFDCKVIHRRKYAKQSKVL